MMADDCDDHPGTSATVLRESIEVGEFYLSGDHLTASLRVVVYGRTEDLILVVQPFGEEVGVEVHDAVLDFAALTVVAECVAAKLSTVAGRAALKQASEGTPQNRRWGPQVRTTFNRPGGTSNG